MENIPEGYDENGVRGGYGVWNDDEDLDELEDVCPECGSPNTHRSDSDFLVCDDCGYEEVPDDEMGVCERCGVDTPNALLVNGLCPACVDDISDN